MTKQDRVAPESVRIFAILMLLFAISILKSLVDNPSIELWKFPIRATLAVAMLVAAGGLWQAKPWGLKLYWVTALIFMLHYAIVVWQDAVSGRESIYSLLTVWAIVAVFLVSIGIGVKGSLAKKRS